MIVVAFIKQNIKIVLYIILFNPDKWCGALTQILSNLGVIYFHPPLMGLTKPCCATGHLVRHHFSRQAIHLLYTSPSIWVPKTHQTRILGPLTL